MLDDFQLSCQRNEIPDGMSTSSRQATEIPAVLPAMHMFISSSYRAVETESKNKRYYNARKRSETLKAIY